MPGPEARTDSRYIRRRPREKSDELFPEIRNRVRVAFNDPVVLGNIIEITSDVVERKELSNEKMVEFDERITTLLDNVPESLQDFFPLDFYRAALILRLHGSQGLDKIANILHATPNSIRYVIVEFGLPSNLTEAKPIDDVRGKAEEQPSQSSEESKKLKKIKLPKEIVCALQGYAFRYANNNQLTGNINRQRDSLTNRMLWGFTKSQFTNIQIEHWLQRLYDARVHNSQLEDVANAYLAYIQLHKRDGSFDDFVEINGIKISQKHG